MGWDLPSPFRPSFSRVVQTTPLLVAEARNPGSSPGRGRLDNMIKNTPDPTRILVEEGQLRHCYTCACMHMHTPTAMGWSSKDWKLCPFGHETVAVQFRFGANGLTAEPAT